MRASRATSIDKLDDCATIFRLVRSTPAVSLHIPWDRTDDLRALQEHARARGLHFDAMNSNTFQDQADQRLSYKFGSLTHADAAVRRQAIEHNLECIRIGAALGSSALSVWIGDGGNFPGQVHARRALQRYIESMREIHAALPPGWRLFLEHKLYEPAFYSTVINDWGTSYYAATEIGPQARCLVDLGHHAPSVNIEMIVARLIQAGRLGGFHFNDSMYGDDDLDAGAVKPFQLFLVFHELVDAELDRVPGFDPAYMLDQSHNVTDPIESIMTSAVEVTRAYIQALLVDRAALAEAQERSDAIAALGDPEAGVHDRRLAAAGDGTGTVWWRDRSAGGLPGQRLPTTQEHRAAGLDGRRGRHRVSAGALYVAVDLGAGSGRVFTGMLGPGGLELEQVARFRYPAREVDGHLRWDFPAILREIRAGLGLAAERARATRRQVASVGVDSWGVDYGLVDRDGRLLEDPISYRDGRTEDIMPRVFARVPREEIFARTGIQFLPINTLFQLAAHVEQGLPGSAHRLLMIPDLVTAALTGREVTEFTNATTTQMVHVETRRWDIALLDRLGLPSSLCAGIVDAGSRVGALLENAGDDHGLAGVPLTAVATHDTGSAVAGTPLDEGWAFISSGTWSLVGLEIQQPLVTPNVARANVTNEGGAYRHDALPQERHGTLDPGIVPRGVGARGPGRALRPPARRGRAAGRNAGRHLPRRSRTCCTRRAC